MNTRKADRNETTVIFYRRKADGVQWQLRHRVWHETYPTMRRAKLAVTKWLNKGKILRAV